MVMPKPRLTPPVITIGRVKRRMTGNATDGYRCQIDPEFVARVRNIGTFRTEAQIEACGQVIWFVCCRNGIHEQAAANAVGKWFEARANGWGAPVVDRRAQ